MLPASGCLPGFSSLYMVGMGEFKKAMMTFSSPWQGKLGLGLSRHGLKPGQPVQQAMSSALQWQLAAGTNDEDVQPHLFLWAKSTGVQSVSLGEGVDSCRVKPCALGWGKGAWCV